MKIRTLNVCVAAALLAAGGAQRPPSFRPRPLPPTADQTSAGQGVNVKYAFALKYDNNESLSCGAKREFSDGTPTKHVKLSKAQNPSEYVESKQYTSGGS